MTEISKKKAVLVFGGSDYQLTLVLKCKELGLFTVVIDPNPEAMAQEHSDEFEAVGGQDFEGTCKVVENYNIDAIITAATDKPLVMMAKVAEKYNLNFFPVDTVIATTDKYLMKQKFIENGIPCAKGRLINNTIPEDLNYPLVLKPRDNSGSRGVVFCDNKEAAVKVIEETMNQTRLDSILAEEVVEGDEYSIESLHYNGETRIIQITEKITTPLPYYIEMGHIQPPSIAKETLENLTKLIHKASKAFNFDNCGSHNEVKIKDGKITLIEVSPRIGGDLIVSTLVPLSTGIDMEKALIQIVLGEQPQIEIKEHKASGIFFFNFKQGTVKKIESFEYLRNIQGVVDYKLYLKEGSVVPQIKLGTDRYGYVILKSDNREELLKLRDEIFSSINIEIE